MIKWTYLFLFSFKNQQYVQLVVRVWDFLLRKCVWDALIKKGKTCMCLCVRCMRAYDQSIYKEIWKVACTYTCYVSRRNEAYTRCCVFVGGYTLVCILVIWLHACCNSFWRVHVRIHLFEIFLLIVSHKVFFLSINLSRSFAIGLCIVKSKHSNYETC